MKAESTVLSPGETSFLVRQRVARLATATASGEPHAVPVCYAFDGRFVHIALDEKPKDVPPTRLKRVRNILENPRVVLVTDRYSEDWDLLAFVMVHGRAELTEPGSEEHTAAVRLLRGKYYQYEKMAIEENPVISILPERAASWGALDAPETPESLMDALLGRRSVRRYLDREVLEEAVERVLEAARWAPSPHGRQPWRFAVITREETKARLAEAMGEEWRSNLEMDGQSAEVAPRRAGPRTLVPLSRGPGRLPGRRAPGGRDDDGRAIFRGGCPERVARRLRLRPRRGLDVRSIVLPAQRHGGSWLGFQAYPARASYAGIRGGGSAEAPFEEVARRARDLPGLSSVDVRRDG
jgi:PPOX class probable F420-dependent enzyme